MDEPREIEYGLGPQLRSLIQLSQARERGDTAGVSHHSMMARLAANRERNRLNRYKLPQPQKPDILK